MNRMLEAKPIVAVRASGWVLAFAAFAVAVVVLLACYWQTLQSLVWIWDHDGTYQYAFLIFPLSVWAALGLRHRLRANPPKPSVWGLLAMVGLVCIWDAGRLFDVNLLQHVALVVMFPALVLACWGWRALWLLKFPLGYLLFAVPWGNGLVGPLQDFTAHFAVHALELTGTPVLLNGREIVTPSAVWMVADACSGVKFFIASSALGCLYAWLMYRRWWKRLLFVALAAVVPIIANGFRVYFTVLIGDTWGLEYATGTDHMIFGWQFFGTVLVLLLLAGWFFRDRPAILEHPPVNDDGVSSARLAVWPAALAVLIAGPLLAPGPVSTVPQEGLRLSAPALAGWSAPQAVVDAWRPEFKGAAGRVQAAYRSSTNGNTVELFHAVYTGRPRRGHSLITYGNDVYDPGNTRLLASSLRDVELAGRAGITARELRLADADGPRLVWYWYCVNQRCNASPVLTKLLQAWDVLRGRVPRSSVWALSAQAADGDMAAARKNLLAFTRVLSLTDISGLPRRSEPAASGNVQ